MEKRFVSLVVLIAAIIALFCEVLGEYYVYTDYFLTQGKSRAFVTFRHAWRFYYCFVGLAGMLLLIIAFFRRENRRFLALALMLSLLATILPLFDLWSYFIP